MTEHEEEQKSELEALRSIYSSDEFVELSDSPYTFEISLTVEGNEDLHALKTTIQFMYTPSYPDTPPETSVTGGNLDPGQISELEQLMRENADELVGSVMVFTLVSMVQDWLGERVDAAARLKQEELEKKEQLAKQLEEAIFHGTPVTKETFNEWQKKFIAEFKGDRRVDNKEKRLTGKQLFEKDSSLATSDMQFLAQEDDPDTLSEAATNQLSV